MAESKNAEMDLAAFRDDLAALKHDVASLIEHVKGGAADKFRTPPSKSIAARAESATTWARKASARSKPSATGSRSSRFSRC